MPTITQRTLAGHVFDYDQDDSAFGILYQLFSGNGINLIRFDYKGKAIAPMSAAGRIASGETKSPDALGHVRHGKEQLAYLYVGSHKDNLNVLLCRDMSSRKIKLDNSYDYRAYIMASPMLGVKIKDIEVQHNFKSWESISLDNMNIFPVLTEVNDLEMLSMGLILRAQIKHNKALIDAEKKRLVGQFKTLVKKGETSIVGEDGIVYYYQPTGSTLALVDENGERVGGVANFATNGVTLVPKIILTNDPIAESGKELETQTRGKNAGKKIIKNISDLPWLFAESKRLAMELKVVNSVLRPFELAVIESNLDDDYAAIAGQLFTISKYPVKSYDYPEETADRLNSGEWKMVEVPKTSGRNLFNPDPNFDPNATVDTNDDSDDDDE